MRGWAIISANALVPMLPAPTVDPGTATLLRTGTGNALDISIGNNKLRKASSSAIPAAVNMVIRFTSGSDLPQDPEVFVPMWNSTHLTIVSASRDATKRGLILMVQADRLGTDLMLSTLFSPTGAMGVCYSAGSRSEATTLVARAEQPYFGWATVWDDPSGAHQDKFRLRSEVEYPIVVSSVSIAKNRVVINKKLKPGKMLKVGAHLPNQISDVEVTKRTVLTVPRKFRQGSKLILK